MAPITAATEVALPQHEVFGYVTDPARFCEWQQDVISGYMEGDGPHGAGAKCVTIRRIGFAKRRITAEISHIDPPRAWGVRGIDGPIRAVADVAVRPLEEGRSSRLTITLSFEGHGIGRLLVPLLVRRQARKEMPENLNRLKMRLETGTG